MICRICKNTHFFEITNLGTQPLSGIFPLLSEPTPKAYELKVIKCDNITNPKACGLMQFEKAPPVEEMYGLTYGYHSSISPLMVAHLQDIAREVKAKVSYKPGDAILDIGCNDGTLLGFFDPSLKRMGMDPSSKKFLEYFQPGIEVFFDFFDAKKIKEKHGNIQFKSITSIAMFYDLEDPTAFMQDIYSVLADDGIWAFEFSYLPLMLTNLTHDQICHEHVTYLGLKQIHWMAEKVGLKIVDVSLNEINGGSILVFAAKKESALPVQAEKIAYYLDMETAMDKKSTYALFDSRIQQHRLQVKAILQDIQDQGKTVWGYGASTKGNIMLNYCNITPQWLPFICDESSKKFGRKMPGSEIPIVSKEAFRTAHPDYAFVLIWPFRKEVIQSEMAYLQKGGKLIFHLPQLHIVDKDNYEYYINTPFSDMSFSLNNMAYLG